MKIAIIKASDYLSKRFDERREQLIASGVVLVPVNDAYVPHMNRQERFQIFYGGSGSGKSHFVATLLLLRALKKQHFRCLYVRKYERSVRTSQFALLQDLIASLGLDSLFDINRSDMHIRCTATGNSLIPAGLDDIHKVRSIPGISAIWIEEVIDRRGSITEHDFQELNRRLRVEGVPNQMFLTFNPIMRQSWVHRRFFEQKEPDTFILRTTHEDNLFLPPEFRAQLELLKHADEEEYNVFTKGEWGSLDDDDLFIFKEEAVLSLPTNADFIADGVKYITADLAFEGADKTVIMVWSGWKVVDVKVLDRSDARQIVSAIRGLASLYQIPQSRVAFDAGGVGTAMRALMPAALAFDAATSPIETITSKTDFHQKALRRPPYRNLRAQVYDLAAQRVNNAEAAYAAKFGFEQLRQELLAIRWASAGETFRYQIEPKADIRARINRSPDFADAFAMRAIFDLQSATQKKARKLSGFAMQVT